MLTRFSTAETPRFMAKKHNEVRAAETLSYLRNLPIDHVYIQEELSGIMNQVENERALTAGSGRFEVVKETFGLNNRIRLMKGVILMIFFQFRYFFASFSVSTILRTDLGLPVSQWHQCYQLRRYCVNALKPHDVVLTVPFFDFLRNSTRPKVSNLQSFRLRRCLQY